MEHTYLIIVYWLLYENTSQKIRSIVQNLIWTRTIVIYQKLKVDFIFKSLFTAPYMSKFGLYQKSKKGVAGPKCNKQVQKQLKLKIKLD